MEGSSLLELDVSLQFSGLESPNKLECRKIASLKVSPAEEQQFPEGFKMVPFLSLMEGKRDLFWCSLWGPNRAAAGKELKIVRVPPPHIHTHSKVPWIVSTRTCLHSASSTSSVTAQVFIVSYRFCADFCSWVPFLTGQGSLYLSTFLSNLWESEG